MHLEVDEQAAYIGQYDNGALSVLTSAIRTKMPDTAWIFGTEGSIRIPHYWKASEFELILGSEHKTCSFPVPQHVNGITDEGFQFEIRHVQECIRAGLKESPLVPHHATREVLAACDELRNQWGMKFPFEE